MRSAVNKKRRASSEQREEARRNCSERKGTAALRDVFAARRLGGERERLLMRRDLLLIGCKQLAANDRLSLHRAASLRLAPFYKPRLCFVATPRFTATRPRAATAVPRAPASGLRSPRRPASLRFGGSNPLSRSASCLLSIALLAQLMSLALERVSTMATITSASTMTTTIYDFTNGNRLRVFAKNGVIQYADVVQANQLAGRLAARPAWKRLNEWRAEAKRLGIAFTKTPAPV